METKQELQKKQRQLKDILDRANRVRKILTAWGEEEALQLLNEGAEATIIELHEVTTQLNPTTTHG